MRIDARVVRGAELRRQFAVVLPGIFARTRGDLSCQEVHDWPILIRGPRRAVTAKKTSSRTLLPTEAVRTIKQARHKPFKAHRHFPQFPTKLSDDLINHAAAHQGFPHCGVLTPLWAVSEQVLDR